MPEGLDSGQPFYSDSTDAQPQGNGHSEVRAEVLATLRWAYPEWDDYEDAPDIENIAHLAADTAWKVLHGV